jgi:hypothetical protein
VAGDAAGLFWFFVATGAFTRAAVEELTDGVLEH